MTTAGQEVGLGFPIHLRLHLCKAFLKALNQCLARKQVQIGRPALKRRHLNQGAPSVVEQCFIALQVGRMCFHRPMIIWSSATQCAVLRHTAGSDR